MKTAFVTFKNPQNDFTAYTERLRRVSAAFEGAGLKIDSAFALSAVDDIGFKRLLDELKDTTDLIVIALGEETCFDAKSVIAESFGTELTENDNAARFLNAARKLNGVNYSTDYAMLPDGATLIPNEGGAFQGFAIDGEELLTAVVSDKPEELYSMCSRYVLPYAEGKFGVNAKTYTFKIFGNGEKIAGAIAAAKYAGRFEYSLTETDGDYKLDLIFNGDEEIADKVLVSTALIVLLVPPAGAVILPNAFYPAVLVAVIMARELIISGFRLVAAGKGAVIAADKSGKIKTFVTDLTILALLIAAEITPEIFDAANVVGTVMLGVSALLTVISGAEYIVKNASVLLSDGDEEKK